MLTLHVTVSTADITAAAAVVSAAVPLHSVAGGDAATVNIANISCCCYY